MYTYMMCVLYVHIHDVCAVHVACVCAESGDAVPSFESISSGTPGSKKHYHGVK